MAYDYLEFKDVGQKGVGVFSKKVFGKDDVILKATPIKVLDKNEAHASQIAVNKWAHCEPKFIHFMNHSCNANCGTIIDEVGNQTVIAMRHIEAGDELTVNYSLRASTLTRESLPCLCGSEKCIGTIDSWGVLSYENKKLYLEKYSKYIPHFLLEAS